MADAQESYNNRILTTKYNSWSKLDRRRIDTLTPMTVGGWGSIPGLLGLGYPNLVPPILASPHASQILLSYLSRVTRSRTLAAVVGAALTATVDLSQSEVLCDIIVRAPASIGNRSNGLLMHRLQAGIMAF